MGEPEELAQLKLRVPEWMHRRLRAVAAVHRRSINGEVIVRLEASLRAMGSDEEVEAILSALAPPSEMTVTLRKSSRPFPSPERSE